MLASLAGKFDSLSNQLDERLETARLELDELVRNVQLPAVPDISDLRTRAADMFAETPSMNDIVERGWQILIDEVFEELIRRKAGLAPSGA